MANTEQPADVHGTGMPRHSHGYTSFASYSHQDLYNMLFASDPATVREAAAAWQSTGRMLADQAQQLKHRLVNFSQMWQGAAADEYKSMITDLANGLDKVGTGALAMNDLMSQSAEAVEKARAAMPPPQQVPDLDPQVMAAATAAPPSEIAANPGASAQFAASQQQAQQAVQTHQAQLAAASAAQTQAVQVMQTLATDYGSTEDSVPASPESVGTGPTGVPDGTGANVAVIDSQGNPGSMPTLAGMTASGNGSMVLDSSGQLVSSGTAPSASIPSSPLFGHMFTAGLAAASAAASGRFGSVMPRLPSFLNPKPKNPDGTAAASAAGIAARAAAARAAAGAKLSTAGSGGGGGFGGGGLGGVGGGGLTGPSASAYPGLISGSGGAGVTGAAAAGQLAAGAAAGAPGAAGGSAMPMMPMGGMGAGAGGDMGGRRIPPWLVETEDVWGESSAVSPPVIGE
jgi:uncharacterized protein YukE